MRGKKEDHKEEWNNFENSSTRAVLNLNSNRTCPVCTGLPDNSVYTVQTRSYGTVRRPNQTNIQQGQFSWHSPVGGLPMTTPMAPTRPNPRPI